MSQGSTIGYYHERRRDLLEDIADETPPTCCECGQKYDFEEGYTLEFHHVDPDEGHESGIGGWNHFYKVLEDVENDVDLEVRCHGCHKGVHENDQQYYGVEG